VQETSGGRVLLEMAFADTGNYSSKINITLFSAESGHELEFLIR
jgi:hypothetical protein